MIVKKPFLLILYNLPGLPLAEGYTRLMKHLGFTNLTVLEALSLMWMEEPNWVLGILAFLGVSTWETLLVYYSTKFWGTDYLPLKGMLIVMTCQAIIFSLYGILGGQSQLAQSVTGNYVHASGAAFGGLLVGYILKKFIVKPQQEKEEGFNNNR
ncbi:MAG: hypothetical protein GX081_05480 [Firmicutes bacterium]|nr:hypothetical protein [Bacillota bacterium]